MLFLCMSGIFIPLYLFLISPNTKRKHRMRAFETVYIAHRGLYRNGSEAPENTLPAFQKAVRAGLGIELDVQLTKDKQLVVFHDYDLKRMTGVDLKIKDCMYADLKHYTLLDSGQTIPLLKEVLQLINGAVPLIIELKVKWDYKETCQRLAKMLQTYRGDYCIESFSPLAVRWYKKHQPLVLRGQLAERFKDEASVKGLLLKGVLSNCLLNFWTKPDFIAYNYEHANTAPVWILKHICHARLAAWTVKSRQAVEENQTVFSIFICEGFLE